MTPQDSARIERFVAKWQNSGGNERANYQGFFLALCEALGVDGPPPKGNVEADPYCFDKDIKVYHPSGKVTPGYIDFYKANHFIIEAKQGSEQTGKGTARRGTPSYLKAMERAFVQAIAYTRNVYTKPPFLLTCDIGSHFELWMGFNGDYGGYAARQDIELAALCREEVFDLFVDIFTNPDARNPEKIAARVTREVAADLAALTKTLEGQHEPQEVAHFLMRCIFTMFAEDVGLLKEYVFTNALKTRWQENPKSFKPEVEALWQAMNEGGSFGFHGQLLRFNGGLFAEPGAFDLAADQVAILLAAAERDWQNVEPAIFGTLLERALDTKERSKLGAHYTPRSYVERLVRPVVMEPLQAQWVVVQGEAKQQLGDDPDPKASQKRKAIATLEAFLTELRQTRILDPACGTGNFLYVTLDLMKQLESEVLKRLEDVTGQAQLRLDIDQVNPSQFLGIEINPRAAAIADLVIWIGYLQWHFRRFGDLPPVEPVLREYRNIECRDAVLAYDGKEPDVDPATGQVRTRWGGRMMPHPVTGEQVPDPSDQVVILKYLNPRPAEWPEADYVVSNPPFIGNARMREALGDGYAETLRETYSDVPETVDYVMYWWHRAALLTRQTPGETKSFGFITTNSICQPRLRRLIEFHLDVDAKKHPLSISFAIPDHPWTDNGAAVRIAMTVARNENIQGISQPKIGKVLQESRTENSEEASDSTLVEYKFVGSIFSNLTSGVDTTSAKLLTAQAELCCNGVKVYGQGFVLDEREGESFSSIAPDLVKPYRNGKDISRSCRNAYVVDCFGIDNPADIQRDNPDIYQLLLERVYPVRSAERNKNIRDKWWLFERPRPELRKSISGLNRYIATLDTSRHRFFVFLESHILPDVQLAVIALQDAYFLGVLSSYVHVKWSLETGGRLGVGNDPRYKKKRCFDPFPFPDPTPEQKQKIRDLGERLDAHRKQVQANHPDITITGMYNLLEKLRAGIPFTDADRDYNNRALVSTLKQIHDDLDLAVLDAYGWPHDITDEQILENLVALNAERAEEERNGLVRWLRPDYQAPDAVQPTQQVLPGTAAAEETIIAPVEQQTFPSSFKEQLAAVRDLLRTQSGEWTVAQVIAQFKSGSRKQKAIQDCLDSLTELGVVAVHAEDGPPRWYIADLQKAA